MKRKILILVVAILILTTGVVSAATNWGKFEGYNIIKLVINGKEAKVQDVPAVSLNNRTMVPIYMLREAGLQVDWDAETSTVYAKNNSTNNNSFDAVKSTQTIMSYGGAGVTIANISNDITSYVYFDQKKGLDSDWDNIWSIFVELTNYNTIYSRVGYGINGKEQGYIEIKTNTLKSYINGSINEDTLTSSWVFKGSIFNNSTNNTTVNIKTSYPELYSNDLEVYLGKLTTNTYDSDSVFNEFGTYGSKFSANSIWNSFGDYGSEFSNTSAFNKFTFTPPAIVHNDKIIGYVTTNTSIVNGVSPYDLQEYIEDIGY